jgi:nucleoid DNA-binding protein
LLHFAWNTFSLQQHLLYQQKIMAGGKQNAYMFDIIASSFFQKKTCRLPGIGNLELATTPAEYDFGNKQIKAPKETILFIAASPYDNSFNEFSAISQLMKDELDKKGSVAVTGLGSFTKDSGGTIHFSAVELDEDFYQPVKAEKVIHKDAEHSILVGDEETTNVKMNEYYSEAGEATGSKGKWWVWAIVLGAAGLAAIGYYLYANGFNNLASKAAF